MVNADTILHAIARALRSANGVDDDIEYVVKELDGDNNDSAQGLPNATIQATDRNRRSQTPEETPITDDSGGRIGTFYRVPISMDVQIEVRTDAGPGTHDATTLGEAMEDELYRYDAEIRGTDFMDAEGNPLVEINEVRIDPEAARDDLDTSPGIRQWLTTIEVDYNKTLDSTEVFGPQEYVSEVISPQYGDFDATGDGNEVEFDARDHYTTN
ncbi:hypothetical protein [Halococcus saccharolyticus]|uniref:Uncharacterized protein n=1 Tax=Halococcus saccharolyticus DSM 5350 TaxID=1227455 RepID=M0MRN3_9EURY|nr:hypothetical protein [Halococcus saccharolyticus]EMA47998.1 hypothetical protein C449_00960 [Halococcus saccharolyticus DSM 5350]